MVRRAAGRGRADLGGRSGGAAGRQIV